MAIALEDRIRRAFAIASARGSVHLSARVLATGEPGAAAAKSTTVDQAAVAVVLVNDVDARGHASGDALLRRLPCVAVLEDEGRLSAHLAAASVEGVFAVVCRRGVVECTQSGFVLVEVEDGISARETQAEYDVPMLADARLSAFDGET